MDYPWGILRLGSVLRQAKLYPVKAAGGAHCTMRSVPPMRDFFFTRRTGVRREGCASDHGGWRHEFRRGVGDLADHRSRGVRPRLADGEARKTTLKVGKRPPPSGKAFDAHRSIHARKFAIVNAVGKNGYELAPHRCLSDEPRSELQPAKSGLFAAGVFCFGRASLPSRTILLPRHALSNAPSGIISKLPEIRSN